MPPININNKYSGHAFREAVRRSGVDMIVSGDVGHA
jgi:hypothetical protein